MKYITILISILFISCSYEIPKQHYVYLISDNKVIAAYCVPMISYIYYFDGTNIMSNRITIRWSSKSIYYNSFISDKTIYVFETNR